MGAARSFPRSAKSGGQTYRRHEHEDIHTELGEERGQHDPSGDATASNGDDHPHDVTQRDTEECDGTPDCCLLIGRRINKREHETEYDKAERKPPAPLRAARDGSATIRASCLDRPSGRNEGEKREDHKGPGSGNTLDNAAT